MATDSRESCSVSSSQLKTQVGRVNLAIDGLNQTIYGPDDSMLTF